MSDLAAIFAPVDDALHIQAEANTPVAQAQAELLRQQGIEAAQKNRVADLMYQYQLQLPGQLAALNKGGDTSSGSSNNSGMLPGDPAGFGAVETEDNPSAGNNTAGAQIPGSDSESGHGLNVEKAVQGLTAKYAPLPSAYTQSELALNQTAAVTGNQALAQFVKTNHDARLETVNGQRSKAGRDEYNSLVGIDSAPDGHALDALSLIDPVNAQKLQDVGATDAEVRHFAAQLAGKIHTIAQLPTEYSTDGTAIDAVTKEPILGYDHAVGLNADQRAQLAKQSTEKVDMPNSDGTTSKVPRWKAEGADSKEDWLSDHMQLAASIKNGSAAPPQGAALTAPSQGAPRIPWVNGQPNAAPAAGPGPAGSAPANAPAAPQGPAPNAPRAPVPASAPAANAGAPAQPNPNAPKPSAALLAAANKTIQVPQPDGTTLSVPQWKYNGYASPQAFAQHAANLAAQHGVSHDDAGTALNTAAQQDADGLLPGVNIDGLPKTQTAPVKAGVTQSPEAAEAVKTTAAARVDALKTASEAAADAAKTKSLITQAQAELNKVDPRTVGPGSPTYNALLGIKTAISGKPPQGLVDEVTLNKFLNQLGAQNVRNLLQGQRITNQEMMTFLTQGSPSTAQPLSAIKGLVNYLAADNDYDARLQKTKIAALQRGADPYQLNGALETANPRAGYVQQRTGVTPPLTRGGSQSGNGGAATGSGDSGGFIPGKRYTDKGGNSATYLGNGKWQ